MNFFIAALSTEMSPLGADKNSLDWWIAKKEEYPMLARLAPAQCTQAERVFSWCSPEQEEALFKQHFLEDNFFCEH